MQYDEQYLSESRTCAECGSVYTVQNHVEYFGEEQVAEYPLDLCTDCLLEAQAMEEAYPPPYDPYEMGLSRICVTCNCQYKIENYWPGNQSYFPPPYDYFNGCREYCLGCWLGDEPSPPDGEDMDSNESTPSEAELQPSELDWNTALKLAPLSGDGWPYEQIYEALCQGDLTKAYHWYFEQGMMLTVMPVGRLNVRRVVTFPRGFVFFPKGYLDLSQLNFIPNSERSVKLNEAQSAASGITQRDFHGHALVVFPCAVDWDGFRKMSHAAHLELIRLLGESVDRNCLDFARFRECRLDDVEGLPCHAGQVPYSNVMMAGLAVYSPEQQESRIVAGAAYTHCVTQGMGMELRQYEWDQLPRDGRVGWIASAALALYSQLLAASSQTSKFVQAMSLLEFLAYPDHMAKFEEVKKVIARYLAPEGTEPYQTILNRFLELTGKQDKQVDKEHGMMPSRAFDGFRTRIVHLGQRLEQILPSFEDRSALFAELDSYIKPVIRHMIKNSSMDFSEYAEYRKNAFAHFRTN